MSTAVATQRGKRKQTKKTREWAPRFWEGCNGAAWFRMLFRHHFAVNWRLIPIALSITAFSLLHTFLRLVQRIYYGCQPAQTPIREAPLFIIGHWRTGTTLLHELLILDDRHTFPNTYDCLAPNHFLLSEKFFVRRLRFLVPAHRPMDNMAAGWERPQEDEFALCMLGQPSPYLTIAFPNHGPEYPKYLDLEGLSPRAIKSWKKTFLQFLSELTFKDPRRLVLKSPPHTCRIKVLLEMFPDARFVHIVRDPYTVFPSTVNLWKSLYQKQGLQRPTFAGLEEYVFTTFRRVYEKLEEGRELIPSSNFHELRYEDLIRDPVGEMRALYDQLGLGGFDQVLPQLEKYLKSVSGYETNRYQLSDEQRAEISRRWGDVIQRYGYERG